MRSTSKFLLLIGLFFSFTGCAWQQIPYEPDERNVSDPIVTVKAILERQSPAYINVSKVIVTDQHFRIDGTGSFRSQNYPITVYFENVGKTKIYKKDYYWIDIYDKLGNYMATVFPADEVKSKRFADAIYFLSQKEPMFE